MNNAKIRNGRRTTNKTNLLWKSWLFVIISSLRFTFPAFPLIRIRRQRVFWRKTSKRAWTEMALSLLCISRGRWMSMTVTFGKTHFAFVPCFLPFIEADIPWLHEDCERGEKGENHGGTGIPGQVHRDVWGVRSWRASHTGRLRLGCSCCFIWGMQWRLLVAQTRLHVPGSCRLSKWNLSRESFKWKFTTPLLREFGSWLIHGRQGIGPWRLRTPSWLLQSWIRQEERRSRNSDEKFFKISTYC